MNEVLKYRVYYGEILLFLLCGFILCLGCGRNRLKEYSFEDIKNSYLIEMPVNHPREAVEYAKVKMPFEKALAVFEELESQSKVSGWTVYSKLKTPSDDIKSRYKIRYKNGLDSKEEYKKNVQLANDRGNYWEVIFRSKGVLPSYSWKVSFLPNGKMIKNRAGWDK